MTPSHRLQLALRRTVRKARLQFGVRFTPLVILGFWNWKPPPEVPSKRWFETLAEELNRDDG
jgi:hypothetical protein